VEFLELPDGDLAAHGDAIGAAVRAACWQDATLVSPWAYDRHPDHEACARAARTVAADQPGIDLLEFPIWAWHWGDPAVDLAHQDAQTTATRRLTLPAEARRQKQAAIACYPSQTEPLSAAYGDEAVLTQESLAYFARDCECFFLIDPSRS
jgi:LmbE family N-acetylglucosaminyl deacetylase